MATPKLTILLSGMIAGVPHQGGATWAILQYLLGFKRLGYNVHFIEPVEQAALRPAGVPLARSDNAAYFRRVMAEFGMGQTSALLLAGTQRTVGLSYERLREIARRADVLVNISGLLTDEALTEDIPLRAYLDLDPAFTQLWQVAEGIDMCFAAHNRFVTVGQAIGDPDCEVPTCGLEWVTTPQPVVLERWPAGRITTHDALTTVANWRGYGSIEHEGVFYGQKAHSWRQFFSLPALSEERFAPALAIHPEESKDLAALRANGWRLIDPERVTQTPAGYQCFVRGSKAEFGIAKSGYVASRCGWFSDRSVCYLASGRPVIAQETGFSRFLPVGSGLFAFDTIDEVLASIEALNGDYDRHARAARAVAEEYFDSDRVLERLLNVLGVT
jgi:glycosyltransferase involved in cell wall biosynthesis